MQFCVHLKGKGLAVKSIKGHLAVFTFISKADRLGENTGDFRICKVLEGWSRESGSHPDDRQLISPILQGLLETWKDICQSEFKTALFHAASLTACGVVGLKEPKGGQAFFPSCLRGGKCPPHHILLSFFFLGGGGTQQFRYGKEKALILQALTNFSYFGRNDQMCILFGLQCSHVKFGRKHEFLRPWRGACQKMTWEVEQVILHGAGAYLMHPGILPAFEGQYSTNKVNFPVMGKGFRQGFWSALGCPGGAKTRSRALAFL